MEISTEHIDFIRTDIQRKGLTMQDLVDSILDHICCTIEEDPNADFDTAYQKALTAFGEDELTQIQEETIRLLIQKREITMKKTMYILGYVAAFLSTTGLLLKLQHWPGAAIMLTLGIALLNFGFLPMYFYNNYKKAQAN